MHTQNPYRTPQYNARPAPGIKARPSRWLFAYCLNLPLLVFFSQTVFFGAADWGIFCGLLLLAAFGWGLCLMFPKFVHSFAMGSLVTAAAQFLPVLHFLIGVFTIAVVALVSPSNSTEDLEAGVIVLGYFWEGLVGSLIAGFLMTIVAILLGLLFHLIWPASGRKGNRLATAEPSNFSGPAASGPGPGPPLGP